MATTNSTDFEKLKYFLTTKMRMSHIYQPVMILELLKRNGLMFVATINKTLKSYMFAIVGAEYVLKWLPIGTHEWEKFVKPEDLKKI